MATEVSERADDASAIERARHRSRRRRRLRRFGFAFYALALILVVAGGVNLMSNRRRPATGPVRSLPTLPVTVAPAQAGPTTTVVGGGVNTPPVIVAPDVIKIAATGKSAIPGIAIQDAEATRDTSAIGVIVYAPDGNLFFNRQEGVRLYQPNGTAWIPIIGRITAVNDALASLQYEPRTRRARPIEILTSDFGGGDNAKALAAHRSVPLAVAAS